MESRGRVGRLEAMLRQVRSARAKAALNELYRGRPSLCESTSGPASEVRLAKVADRQEEIANSMRPPYSGIHIGRFARMDLSPLSRLCFGCKLLPMKTIVFILLLSLNARAEEPACKTVAECLYLQGRVEAQLEELRKQTPPPQDKTEPTDNSNRVPQAMTHDEATDYCNGLGGRLPTALELAQLAIKQGGKKYRTTFRRA
jgi:hypothetical protein